MREIDSGRRIGEVSRHLEVSPKLLERWRGEWQARGELAFPVSRHSACAAIWNVVSVLQPNTPVVRQMWDGRQRQGSLHWTWWIRPQPV